MDLKEADLRNMILEVPIGRRTQYDDMSHCTMYLLFNGCMSEVFILVRGGERFGCVLRVGRGLLLYTLPEFRGLGYMSAFLNKSSWRGFWPDITHLLVYNGLCGEQKRVHEHIAEFLGLAVRLFGER